MMRIQKWKICTLDHKNRQIYISNNKILKPCHINPLDKIFIKKLKKNNRSNILKATQYKVTISQANIRNIIKN